MNALEERADIHCRFLVRIVAVMMPTPLLEEQTRSQVRQRRAALLVRDYRARVKRPLLLEPVEGQRERPDRRPFCGWRWHIIPSQLLIADGLRQHWCEE